LCCKMDCFVGRAPRNRAEGTGLRAMTVISIHLPVFPRPIGIAQVTS
jgi:hypothetical protein